MDVSVSFALIHYGYQIVGYFKIVGFSPSLSDKSVGVLILTAAMSIEEVFGDFLIS